MLVNHTFNAIEIFVLLPNSLINETFCFQSTSEKLCKGGGVFQDIFELILEIFGGDDSSLAFYHCT
jgi:hypothetical protein